MSNPSWKTYRLTVVVAAGFALFATFTPAGPALETLLLQWGSRFIPDADPSHAVAVVAIDQATLAQHGAWPWRRDQLAKAVKRLGEFHPRAIGLVLPLSQAETPSAVRSMEEEIESLDTPLRRQAAAWLKQLDTDATLARTLKHEANVIVAASYGVAAQQPGMPQSLARFAVDIPTEQDPWYRSALQWVLAGHSNPPVAIEPPLPAFLDSVAGVGASRAFNKHEHVHSVPLLVPAGNRQLPAFELAVFAVSHGLDSSDIEWRPGTSLRLGGAEIAVSTDIDYYPRPAAAVPVYSLGKIMQSKSLGDRLRGKTVLLGLTVPGLVPELAGPGHKTYPPVGWSAQVLSSLLNGTVFDRPAWFHAGQRALILLFALYLVSVPPSWHGTRGLIASGVASIAILNAGLLTLVVREIWLPVMGPTLFLLAMQLLLAVGYRRYRVVQTAYRDANDARIALGGNLQSQGQLDMALQQFTRCLPDPSAFQPLHELALEFERRRQINKAVAIYEQLETIGNGFRDAANRRKQLSELSDRFPNANISSASKTLVLDVPVMELPVLGRYRLERELGRGAMGTVYLAQDPTIGRAVAIKTLPLLEHYEEREQEEVAKRFFQEAEAVGRLDHPNIVTIYDAGKEHDLAYMAMDYVAGDSLEMWTHKSELLPVWEVLEIAAQVADALDYAHQRKVVHRDIKPSNIIYDRDNGLAKITDFGVARILDASRTRTGTVLGSPCYMSPEQVAGKKADGRSDLFSLGITIYQLLSGDLPFAGDSVAALMYQITHEKTPPIRKTRRGLPVCVSRLVSKAMQKEPAKRFASGEEMAVAIRKCRAQFKGGRRKTA